MKRVECGRGVSELISKKWEHKKIGLYYCFEKNNKIYIPFGNRIEIYDKSEYVKLYGDEISEEEHKELSNNADNKLTQYDTECNKNFKPKKELGISGGRRMTDKDIIKALECCSMQSYPACKECPYHDNYSNRECIGLRNTDIKDLINRQQAENERLSSSAKQWEEIAKDLLISKEKQQAEIEKLNVELVGMRGACNSYKMHYDNAKAEIERLNNNISAMVTTLSNSAKETRVEAIKEFAGVLRQQAFDRLYVSIDEIDNLVKEMTEPSLLDKKIGGEQK